MRQYFSALCLFIFLLLMRRVTRLVYKAHLVRMTKLHSDSACVCVCLCAYVCVCMRHPSTKQEMCCLFVCVYAPVSYCYTATPINMFVCVF
jgi:hypothetical protein